MPQIFTFAMARRSLFHRSARRDAEKRLKCRSRLGTFHQVLADEEGVEARVAEAREVVMGGQARCADGDALVRNSLHEFERCFEMNGEIAQIAIVHADDSRVAG